MISNNAPITQAAAEAVRSLEEGMGRFPQPNGGQGVQGSTMEQNVGSSERTVSIVAGAAFGLLALSKPLSVRGLLLGGAGAALLYRGFSGTCSLYGKLGINTRKSADDGASAEPKAYFKSGIHVEQSVTINKPAQELYNFWRNFENLPRVMDHLNSVKVSDHKRSRWSAKAPLGTSVEWDAEIINDEPGKLIAWQSVGDATVDNSGSVRFLDHGGSTQVRVVLDYIPPAGKLGAIVARLFGESPDVQVRDDLQRFKQLMENGG
jgi:uncharacterized membrane protein